MSFELESPVDKLPSLPDSERSAGNVWSNAAMEAYKSGTKVAAEAPTTTTCTIDGVEYPVKVLPPGEATNTFSSTGVGHFSYRNCTSNPTKPTIYGGYKG